MCKTHRPVCFVLCSDTALHYTSIVFLCCVVCAVVVWSLLRKLEDDTELSMLCKYPIEKERFLRTNTSLPFSAPVERFSLVGILRCTVLSAIVYVTQMRHLKFEMLGVRHLKYFCC